MRKTLASGILAAALGAASATGLPVYVKIAPPAAVVETRVAAPGPGYVWVAGFHRWDGKAYAWVPGHWVVPPRPHAAWVPGHWVHSHHGYWWKDGHWR